MTAVSIRPARPQDVPTILALIRALAEYEKLLHEVTATEAALHAGLFGPRPHAEAVLAWDGDEAAGFALYFHSFSTFLARPGIYLEDLFVRPEYRGRGIGKALLAEVARVAVARGCGRLEWAVLDWNAPAIAFYRRFGAQALADWTVHRISGPALHTLAAQARPR
ncbi:Ribosomal protein S18 acetylase RimI [Fontimonas thermophila]|uniref:Ribosomal protein S18 acetylase RimI n=1 Tax=Fontimonas thermophila TaxID=1076937 RepID=A0A1I2HWA9_9GAMM|nr:GNAT family N-acetyltransferase [Fontimonas thermophila]SFF33838.1 Ribosomal protein S18 acetylase RimI [Fontimonas thermophila]